MRALGRRKVFERHIVVLSERGQAAEGELDGPARGDARRRRELRTMRKQAVIQLTGQVVGSPPQGDISAAREAERERAVERELEPVRGYVDEDRCRPV